GGDVESVIAGIAGDGDGNAAGSGVDVDHVVAAAGHDLDAVDPLERTGEAAVAGGGDGDGGVVGGEGDDVAAAGAVDVQHAGAVEHPPQPRAVVGADAVDVVGEQDGRAGDAEVARDQPVHHGGRRDGDVGGVGVVESDRVSQLVGRHLGEDRCGP